MCAIVVANFKAYQELVFFCYLSLDPVPFSPVFVCLALGGELYSFGINVKFSLNLKNVQLVLTRPQ